MIQCIAIYLGRRDCDVENLREKLKIAEVLLFLVVLGIGFIALEYGTHLYFRIVAHY